MTNRERKTNNEINEESNTIKVGMFQLQTKSFWLGLVAILVLFLFGVIWLNTYYWYNICKLTIENNIVEKTKISCKK